MSSSKIRRAYGLWDSPITPLSLARGNRLSDIAWAEDGSLLWLEGRSDRGVVAVQLPDGQAWRDLNDEFSVRARVGYGGGDFTAGHGCAYFVAADSGRIYRQPLAGGLTRPLTPAFGRAPAPKLSPDGRWLVFVHSYEEQDTLEMVDSAGNFWPQKLVSGDDFYMQPAWHPDGKRLAWIAWSHPNMPWDGTRLCLGSLVIPSGSLPFLADYSGPGIRFPFPPNKGFHSRVPGDREARRVSAKRDRNGGLQLFGRDQVGPLDPLNG